LKLEIVITDNAFFFPFYLINKQDLWIISFKRMIEKVKKFFRDNALY